MGLDLANEQALLEREISTLESRLARAEAELGALRAWPVKPRGVTLR